MTIASVGEAPEAAPWIDFGPFGRSLLDRYADTPARQLYYWLLNVDERADVLPTAFQIVLQQASRATERASRLPNPLLAPEYPGAGLDEWAERARAWSIQHREDLVECLNALTLEQCAYLLKQYAPTALVDACWLQNASNAATSHTETTTRLFKLYTEEIGDSDLARHHGNAYRDLMHSLGICVPDVASCAFVEQRDVLDSSFEYPVFLLSLSQFPRSFKPELIGLNLFYYICGICPVYLALRDRLQEYGASIRFLDWHRLDVQVSGPADTARDLVRLQMDEAGGSAGAKEQCWRRIWRGWLSAYTAQQPWLDEIVRFARSPGKRPREEMIKLITRMARHAHGYHPGVMLGGRPIDEWMAPDALNPEAFLDALARSPFVTPGDAAGSRFLRDLVSFRGPMFRVFSPEELQTIADWINALPEKQESADRVSLDSSGAGTQVDAHKPSPGSAHIGRGYEDLENDSIRRYAKKPVAELYYYLLNLEYFPDVRPFAKHFATRWLRLAGKGLRRDPRPLPFEPYRHEALNAWLDAQHRRQVDSYRSLNGGPPRQSRDRLVRSTTQLAPMTLIDGSWIQNAANAGRSHERVASKLFHIYADEVGNGEFALNHPNVFRDLLREMQVETPEFGTMAYSQWPGFRTEAFHVPVFWLSISQFPQRFLPETLGLNLAMELSGVGGAYREAIDTLRYYGFDPLYCELHNTIDNVSTGHTAWAVDAIKCHLDEVSALGGEKQVAEHWERIWTGYRALVPPKKMFGWFRMWT